MQSEKLRDESPGDLLVDAAVEVTLFVENLAEHDGNLGSANCEHLRCKGVRISQTCDGTGLRQEQAIQKNHGWRQRLRGRRKSLGLHNNAKPI
jgi:hypothetical protein